MKVSWTDIRNSELPGEYNVENQCILVQRSDIDFWKIHPEATFDVIDARFKDGGIGHVLYDLSEASPVD